MLSTAPLSPGGAAAWDVCLGGEWWYVLVWF